MSDVSKRIWLWGQTPGGYDQHGYNLPRGNRMTPCEALDFFGIENVCRVKLDEEADQSFLTDPWLGEPAKKVCLSLVGAGGEVPKDDLEDILTLAAKDERIVSAVMDDFISPKRMKVFTPDKLRYYAERLRTGAPKPLELWSVLYEKDLDHLPADRVGIFDVTTFWTWFGEHLDDYSANYEGIRRVIGDGRLMLGVYMYDFGNRRPLSDDAMKKQLDFVGDKLVRGEIEGAVLCSNVIADLGLTAVDITRDWIRAL